MPHRTTPSLGPRFAPPKRPQRMLAVALLAGVLFNQPFLRIFDRGASVGFGGVPMIYLYLFAAWALVIVLMVTVVEVRAEPAAANEDAAAGPGAAGHSAASGHAAPSAHTPPGALDASRDRTEG